MHWFLIIMFASYHNGASGFTVGPFLDGNACVSAAQATADNTEKNANAYETQPDLSSVTWACVPESSTAGENISIGSEHD